MKQKDGHECISLDLYSNLLNEGCLYEGYVENCGYAFYECVPVSTYVNKTNSFYDLCYVCKLDISPDKYKQSYTGEKILNKREPWFTPDNIKNTTQALSVLIVANDIAVIGFSDDILLPIVLGCGGFCYLVSVIFYKNVGEGNENYPGPWCETQIPKTDYTMREPIPMINPDNFSNGGGHYFLPGLAVAIKDYCDVTRISEPLDTLPKSLQKFNEAEFSKKNTKSKKYSRVLIDMKMISELVNSVYSEELILPKDNTNVVIPKKIIESPIIKK